MARSQKYQDLRTGLLQAETWGHWGYRSIGMAFPACQPGKKMHRLYTHSGREEMEW